MTAETAEPARRIVDMSANPTALGLVGFGMTTILLNFHNAGFYTLGTMILAMGIFYGGLAQIFAGLMDWKKGNSFGTTAFCSYGLFWLSLVALILLPELGLGAPNQPMAMAAYFIMWGIFTAVLFIGTLHFNRAMQVVFATLALLFLLLAIGDITGNATITMIAGLEGIVCGASAMYTGLAVLLNEVYGRAKFPVFPVK
jgi:succinate-acetate transporter protein